MMLQLALFDDLHQLCSRRFLERAIAASDLPPWGSELILATHWDPAQDAAAAMLDEALAFAPQVCSELLDGYPCRMVVINRWNGNMPSKDFPTLLRKLPNNRSAIVAIGQDVAPFAAWDVLFRIQSHSICPILLRPERHRLDKQGLRQFVEFGGKALMDAATLVNPNASGQRSRQMITGNKQGLLAAAFSESPRLIPKPIGPVAQRHWEWCTSLNDLEPSVPERGATRSTTKIIARRKNGTKRPNTRTANRHPVKAKPANLPEVLFRQLVEALENDLARHDPDGARSLCRWATAMLEAEAEVSATEFSTSVQAVTCLALICLQRDAGSLAEAINIAAWFVCSRHVPCFEPDYEGDGCHETALVIGWLIAHLTPAALNEVRTQLEQRFAQRLSTARSAFNIPSSGPITGHIRQITGGDSYLADPSKPTSHADIEVPYVTHLLECFETDGKYRALLDEVDNQDGALCLLYDALEDDSDDYFDSRVDSAS